MAAIGKLAFAHGGVLVEKLFRTVRQGVVRRPRLRLDLHPPQWTKGKGKGKPDDAGGQHRAGANGPGQRVYSGRKRIYRSTESAKIRGLVGVLAALGPEDTSAKTEIAFPSAAKCRGARGPRRARDKVARLEQAVAAMGNCQ